MRYMIPLLLVLIMTGPICPQMMIKDSAQQVRMVITTEGAVGIGTTAPDLSARLDIAGVGKMSAFRMTNGMGANKILKCDANGNGTWQSPITTGLKWIDATTADVPVSLAGRSSATPPPADAADLRFTTSLTYRGTANEMRIGLANTNQGNATVSVVGDLGRVLLTSRTAGNEEYNVDFRAAVSRPEGLDPGINRRLYTNGSLVVWGSGSRFDDGLSIAINYEANRTNGTLTVSAPGVSAGTETLLVYGMTVFSGQVHLPGIPVESAASTYISMQSDGVWVRETSSLRYKDNIKPLQRDFRKLLDAEPVSFKYKQSQKPAIGYIAESLQRIGLTDLVRFNKDAEPVTVYYDKIPVYLLEICRDHEKRLTVLEEWIR